MADLPGTDQERYLWYLKRPIRDGWQSGEAAEQNPLYRSRGPLYLSSDLDPPIREVWNENH